MDLKTYLLSRAVPDREAFAKACGTTYGHLRNVAYGSKPCAESLALNVERESGGVVTLHELLPPFAETLASAGYRRGSVVANQEAPEPAGVEPGYPQPVHDDRRAVERRDGDRRVRGEQRKADRRAIDRRDGGN